MTPLFVMTSRTCDRGRDPNIAPALRPGDTISSWVIVITLYYTSEIYRLLQYPISQIHTSKEVMLRQDTAEKVRLSDLPNT
jgi:hypothetical protein